MNIFQPDRHLLHKFIAKHSHKYSGTILDIGCGGRRYKHLFTHCIYKSLDINPDCKPDIIASIENIPLPDNSIDGILCTQVLGDIWNIKKATNEIVRVLKPGGLLLLTEALHAELHDEPYDFWRLTPNALKRLFSETCTIELLEVRGGYFSMRTQTHIRRLIEKYHLYDNIWLGRIISPILTLYGKWSLFRDTKEPKSIQRKFAIGYNLLAHKRS